RYTRILYPLLARLAALGNREWVPLALVLVNWLAITAGTWAVAAWCLANKLNPWLALVYAFAIGQVVAFTRDLNEPLAFALVALAVYIYHVHPRHRLWAGLVFGLSALAREATLVFGVLYSIVNFGFWTSTDADSNSRFTIQYSKLPQAIAFAALAIGPAVVWQVVLQLWLGGRG